MRKNKQCLVITWINVSLTGMTFLVYRIFRKAEVTTCTDHPCN